MSRKIPGRFWLFALPVGVALVASLMVPLALAQGPPASLVAQTTQGEEECFERRVAFPLEVNMETLGPRFKTIAMEKEIFECDDSPNGPAQVRDVETFVEFVEQVVASDNGDNGDNGGGLRVRHIETRFEFVTCIKSFGGAGAGGVSTQGEAPSVECDVVGGPTGEVDNFVLQNCSLDSKQPDDLVEMATAKTAGVIKTVNVEKELLNCNFSNGNGAGALGATGDVRGELFLFTEILEAARRVTIGGRQVTSIRPIDKRFMAVLCVKDPNTGQPFGCVSFTPSEPPRELP